MRLFFLTLIALCLQACTPRNTAESLVQGDTLSLRYASLLTIVEADSFTTVTVADAWQKGQVLNRYVLVPKVHGLPVNLPEGMIVRTPLERATVFSSVHAALLNDFSQVGRIAGVCDREYVVDAGLKASLQEAKVASLGSSMQPDVERIVQSKSDGLLVSSFKDNSYGSLEKLGVPIIECADYMETSALGRAEWMRFFGRLFGFEAKADSTFEVIEKRYNSLTKAVEGIKKRPRLMVDRRENGTWYVPGGASTLAQMFKDAGFDYCLADNSESGGVAVAFEEMLRRCATADIWLLKYGATTDLQLRDLTADDARYARFQPWQKGQVYACNTFIQPYYEQAPFHPDVLLEELIRLAHPQVLPTSEAERPTFFQRIVP